MKISSWLLLIGLFVPPALAAFYLHAPNDLIWTLVLGNVGAVVMLLLFAVILISIFGYFLIALDVLRADGPIPLGWILLYSLDLFATLFLCRGIWSFGS